MHTELLIRKVQKIMKKQTFDKNGNWVSILLDASPVDRKGRLSRCT